MKKFQRTIAAIAAMAMAISAMSIASFAEDAVTEPEGEETTTTTGLTGEGSFEGTVEATKYNVVLPTVPTGSEDMYNFILDPQGLIKETEAAKYEAATFEDGKYLFFKNTDGTTDYSSESDALTAYNLSSMEVELTVEGKVTGATDLTFTAEAPEEGLNIQLGIADAADTATTQYFAVAEGATDATATYTASLAALSADKFDITYDETDGYVYDYESTFKTSITGESIDYSTIDGVAGAGFKLVGAIANDTDGDKWEDYDGTPSVEIVWSMADPNAVPEVVDEAPNVNGQTTVALTNNETGHTVTIDLGEGDLKATGLAETNAVQYALGTSTTFNTLNSNYTFDAETGSFTINATAAKLLTDGSRIKINLDDGTTITLTFAD